MEYVSRRMGTCDDRPGPGRKNQGRVLVAISRRIDDGPGRRMDAEVSTLQDASQVLGVRCQGSGLW